MRRAWLRYAAVALGIVVAAAVVIGAFVEPPTAAAVWVGAAAACLIQFCAFGLLLLARGRPQHFLVAWGGGSLLRFMLVAGLGLWATRAARLEAEPLLLSAVGFVVLLVLLEPVFLHRGTSRI
jgi:hypothetical protein